MKSNLKNIILKLTIIVILLYSCTCFAEIKEIISEGTYNMGDGETPIVAESRALLQAKRSAIEQAGTYIESYSKVKNYQLTADETHVLASGILEVEILEQNRVIVGKGICFTVKIKARVSTDNLENMARKIRGKSTFVEEYKIIEAVYNRGQNELDGLKKQLSKTNNKEKRKIIENKITETEKLFQAYTLIQQGYIYSLNEEYDKSIEAFSASIALNKNLSRSYYNRGSDYLAIGEHNKAIEDFNRAIKLNPSDASSYNNRSICYGELGQYDNQIKDISKAILIRPNDDVYYFNRGHAHYEKEKYSLAVEDFSKAIKLKPTSDYYCARGSAYGNMGKREQAIKDYTKAIEITSHNEMAYLNRGLQYKDNSQYDLAITDLGKALSLNPKYLKALYNRAIIYQIQGRYDLSIEDLNRVIDISPEAMYYWVRGEIYYSKKDMANAFSDYQKACTFGMNSIFCSHRIKSNEMGIKEENSGLPTQP